MTWSLTGKVPVAKNKYLIRSQPALTLVCQNPCMSEPPYDFLSICLSMYDTSRTSIGFRVGTPDGEDAVGQVRRVPEMDSLGFRAHRMVRMRPARSAGFTK